MSESTSGDRTGANPPSESTRELWNDHADWWTEEFTDGVDPEYTEQIVPLVVDAIGGPGRVLDIGTGSGCLPIWIASKFPDARVMAVDISPEAIAVARRNAKQLGVSERIDILEGDCFAPLPAGATFDLIVSNPPYIPTAEIAALQPEVAVHDPVRALDGGADGLDFYRRFAAEASGRLRRDSKLMLEFGDGQGETLRSLFIEHKWIVEAVVPDYSRRDRFLIARREATE